MISHNIKEVKGFDGYFVSDNGIVYTTRKNGGYHTSLRELKSKEDKDGYLEVAMYSNKKRYWRRVHRIVAETFIPNINNYPQINHIDGNKKNNNVNNLEWCTCRQNIIHSFNVLKRKPTISNKRKIKLTNRETNDILYFETEKECAFYLKMSYQHLNKILNGHIDISVWRKNKIYKIEFVNIEDVTTIL